MGKPAGEVLGDSNAMKVLKKPFEDKSDAPEVDGDYFYKGFHFEFSQGKHLCRARIYDDEKNVASIIVFCTKKQWKRFEDYQSKKRGLMDKDPFVILAAYGNPHSFRPSKIPYSNLFFKNVAKHLYEKEGVRYLMFPSLESRTGYEKVERQKVFKKGFWDFFH